MSFTTRDAFLVIGMIFAIIMMNAFFMHSGIQDDKYQEGQMPELDLSAAQVDLTPSTADSTQPGAPSQGFVSPIESFEGAYDFNSWIRKDSYYVTARDSGSYTEVALKNTSEVDDVDSVQLENVSETGTLTGEGWTIDVELVEKTGNSTSDGTWIVQYSIEKQPSTGSGWMSSLPVVGGLYDSGNELASMVGWIGAMIYYGITWIVGGFINVLIGLGVVTLYLVSLLTWLAGTYVDIVALAPGWSSIIVGVPGAVIALELVKGFVTVIGASNWL